MAHSTNLIILYPALTGLYVFLFPGAGSGLNLLRSELITAVAFRTIRPATYAPLEFAKH